MENIHKLEAGYILYQLWTQIKSSLVVWFDQVPFFLPLLIIFSVLIVLLLIVRKLLAVIDILKQERIFLELTPPSSTQKSAYTTQQFFSLLHNIGSQRTIIDKLLGRKVLFSFEIVSTREKGILYIIKTTPQEANNIERLVVSYLPYVQIQRIDEYLPEKLSYKQDKVIEFRLSRHFAFPLQK